MDLKIKAKPRFLKCEDQKAWSLTDLENETILCGHIGGVIVGLDVILQSSHNLYMSVEYGTYFR